jgi:hypothetical protein
MKGFVVLAILGGVFAGPGLAAMVVPGAVEQVAQAGLSVHHHFVFDKSYPVQRAGQAYDVYLADGDLYELPVTTTLILRGSVHPAPSDEQVRQAVQYALDTYHVPVLNYDVERSGEAMVVHATLPAGVFAELSPQYRGMLAQYEQD